MSFRTAYHSFRSGRRTTTPRALIRDYTPEQERKMLDDYYIREQARKNGTSNNKRR